MAKARKAKDGALLIVPYNAHLSRAVYDVFYRAVHDSCARAYTPEQLDAWAPPYDPQVSATLAARLERNYCLVACLSFDAKDDVGGSMQVAGFASLTASGHLDHLFVDPQLQRHGIGRELYQCLEHVCSRAQQSTITTDASLTARPFFEAMGMTVQAEQQVTVRGQTCTNFHMVKTIEAKPTLAQALAAALAEQHD